MGSRIVVRALVLTLAVLGLGASDLWAETALELHRYANAQSQLTVPVSGGRARVDVAIVRSGIARYRLGDFDEAIELLSRVSPTTRYPEARLYLALSHLLKREDSPAEAELVAYTMLTSNPAVLAQVGRALSVMRLDPLSDRIRGLIAASLEAEADRDRELREERFAAQIRRRVFPPLP